MSKETKSNEAELNQRVYIIYKLLIKGCVRHDILQYVTEKTDWQICVKQIDNYIAKANALIKKYAKQTREQFTNRAKNKFDHLYKRAMQDKDLRLCKEIILAANKVLGYEQLNVEVTGNKDKPVVHKVNYNNITEEEAQKLFDESLERIMREGKNGK